ncbi:hypothetical protein ACFQYP_00650 [Nonomuraea antimicrobica]
MPWVRVDDQFPMHRKVRPLSDKAFRLYMSALCWANANLTDGTIRTHEITYVSDVSSPRRYARELCDAGLWSKTNEGWQIHDYLEYQASAIKIREERANKRARQERWLDRKRQEKDAQRDASQDASRDESEDAAPIPSHPIPSHIDISSQSSIPPYPAGQDDDDRIDGQDFSQVDEMVKRELAPLAAQPITDEQAARIRRDILGRARGKVKNPHRYIQRALRADLTRYLPEPPRDHRGVGRMCPHHPFMPMPCRACAADRIAGE